MIQDVRLDLKLRPWFWFRYLSDLLLVELCGCETEQEEWENAYWLGPLWGEPAAKQIPMTVRPQLLEWQ